MLIRKKIKELRYKRAGYRYFIREVNYKEGK